MATSSQLIGQTISHYRIVERLGGGGMGVVYKALPDIRAQIAVNSHNPRQAIELLQRVASYDLGDDCLHSSYLRGEAYLLLQQDRDAATQFQNLIDHRGRMRNCQLGALAHLGLARAFAMKGDQARSRVAYQDFLTLWKDADPDIPTLKQAKAEYARLQ